jgi:hypothetical protein
LSKVDLRAKPTLCSSEIYLQVARERGQAEAFRGFKIFRLAVIRLVMKLQS